jgi:hypothetical protein
MLFIISKNIIRQSRFYTFVQHKTSLLCSPCPDCYHTSKSICAYSGGGLFLRTSLAEFLSIFYDLAMGETAATEAKCRWNAEGAGMPPLPNHRKNKGLRHQSEENEATP